MPIGVPNRRDVVFTQRSGDNLNYEEVHASGSNLIFYTDADGRVSADKTSSFFSNVNCLSSSFASQSLSSSYSLMTTCSRVTGSGTNYDLTTTSTRVNFGQGDPDIILPEAGTYLVLAQVQFVGETGTQGDEIRAKIRNITNNVDITVESDGQFFGSPTGREVIHLADVTTVTGSVTASIFAANVTANRGFISSSKTSITYVRVR